jgi:two-component system chemotaxis response regulator CheY
MVVPVVPRRRLQPGRNLPNLPTMGKGAPPRPTVLIVDDSPTSRLRLRTLLEEQGFEVVEASHGLEGLEEARGRPLELMIIDLHMPVMDGLEMVASVRRLDRHRQTPIFLVTTDASAVTVEQGRNLGVTAWLLKPVEGDVLLPAIARALRPSL